MTDRLSLANAIADAKIDRPTAERIATEIFGAIHEGAATTADVQAVRTDVQAARADLQRLEAAAKADLQTAIAGLRGDLLLRLAEVEHRLTVRFASVMVVLIGLLFAALRYLPPVH